MKAKKKPMEKISIESFNLGDLTIIKVLKTEAPEVRKGGEILENVD